MKIRHLLFAALAAFALDGCATYSYVDGTGGYYQGTPNTVYANGAGYYGDGFDYYPYYYAGIWGYMDYGWPGYVGYYGFGRPYYRPYYGYGGRRYYGPPPSWRPAHGMSPGWHGGPRPQVGNGVLRPMPSGSYGGGHYVAPAGSYSRPAGHAGHWSGRGH